MGLSSSFESLSSPSNSSSSSSWSRLHISSSYRLQLDRCSLCKKSLAVGADDVFMYRGDTPFCSEDCRQEQIDMDLDAEEERRVEQQRRRLRRRRQQQQQRENGGKSSFRSGEEAEEAVEKKKKEVMLRAPSVAALVAS